jgi:hypothetical protein
MLDWRFSYRLCGLVVRVPGYRSRGPGFDSRRYQILWEAVGLERGPLSLVRIIEELLEWKSSGSSLENRDYGLGDPLLWALESLYQLKLALTSPAGWCRSVSIVRLQTKTTEFFWRFSYLWVRTVLSFGILVSEDRTLQKDCSTSMSSCLTKHNGWLYRTAASNSGDSSFESQNKSPDICTDVLLFP